jgi:pyruvate kinase
VRDHSRAAIETAIGHDPALVVRTMARIAERAEREADYRQWGTRLVRRQRHRSDGESAADEAELIADRITESLAHAAWQAADDAGASTIICCTRSGRCARNMARFRPAARLLGMSPNETTRRALALSWGVEPLAMDEAASTDDMVWFAIERAVAGGWVATGDTVVVIAGAPDRTTGAAADVMRILRVR